MFLVFVFVCLFKTSKFMFFYPNNQYGHDTKKPVRWTG